MGIFIEPPCLGLVVGGEWDSRGNELIEFLSRSPWGFSFVLVNCRFCPSLSLRVITFSNNENSSLARYVMEWDDEVQLRALRDQLEHTVNRSFEQIEKEVSQMRKHWNSLRSRLAPPCASDTTIPNQNWVPIRLGYLQHDLVWHFRDHNNLRHSLWVDQMALDQLFSRFPWMASLLMVTSPSFSTLGLPGCSGVSFGSSVFLWTGVTFSSPRLLSLTTSQQED